MASPAALIPISNVILEGSSQAYHDSTLTFTVNVANNPETNLMGGVLADITVGPLTPATPQNPYPPSQTLGYPWFSLSRVGGGFVQNFWYEPLTTVYLPNGTYEMKVHQNGYNNNHNTGWDPDEGPMNTVDIVYTVNYKIPDTAQVINYRLGGLRIKSITTKDTFANIASIKRYQYHDPVTDSSYGFFTGSTTRDNKDYLGKSRPGPEANSVYCDYFLFYVRHGNCIMPGSNSLGAAVVYPKVIEYTIEGSNKYKTEYTFSYNIPVYNTEFPYVPPAINEWKHGKPLTTAAFRTMGPDIYQNASRSENVYDFNPISQYSSPGATLTRAIPAVRAAFAGYNENPLSCGFDKAFSTQYATFIGRTDLKSDTTVTYDLNNPYNGVKEWHDFAYGDYTQQPIITRTGNSDGTVNMVKNFYAKDKPSANTNIIADTNTLIASNRVSVPLGTMTYQDGQLLSQQYSSTHFEGAKLLTDNMRQALLNNLIEEEVSVLAYDEAANPLSVKLRGGKYRKYLWNKEKGLPLATCVMAKDYRFAFTSFEYPNEYSWNENSRVLTNPFSGKYAYNLAGGDVMLPPFTDVPHAAVNVDVYVWATGNNFTIGGYAPESMGKTKGNYTLYHKRFASANTLMISSGDMSVLVDQIIAIPVGSQFQGNVYDAANRVTTAINDQINANFFDYDDFGRLQSVKDEKGNILKTSAYQYQGPQ